ncbi:hypothetical protein [Halorientalis salina]|uniref:hypothetical protein n=1 Tax=Halorientalis salina TaxID=2932266 RepID=UPI0010ABD91F|nr:hypothetical protein [Halorientalis salina]
MGLRSWVTELFAAGDGSDDGGAETEGELDLTVDVSRRAATITDHYGLAADDAQRLAEVLDAELTREDGYARTMIVDRVTRDLDVDADLARTIVDTEVASVRNLARVRRFRAQSDGDVRFRWVDSVGTDDSPVCADVRATIDEGGPVTLEELREAIRAAARDHEAGTPERAEDLIPHESCRHTVVRHLEAE